MVGAISYLLNTLTASGNEDLNPRILKEYVKVMIGSKWRSREACATLIHLKGRGNCHGHL